MEKHLFLSFLFTFFIGLLAGGYLYVSGAAGFFANLEVKEEAELTTFTIVGNRYGGCMTSSSCPSFRVLADGSYVYIYSPAVGQASVRREGVLSFGLLRDLQKILTPRSLTRQSQAAPEGKTCASFTDGIDALYEIKAGGASYVIDTCTTNIDEESSVIKVLEVVWEKVAE